MCVYLFKIIKLGCLRLLGLGVCVSRFLGLCWGVCVYLRFLGMCLCVCEFKISKFVCMVVFMCVCMSVFKASRSVLGCFQGC